MKLLTSGFGKEQTLRILLNGAKGYLSKVRRRRINWGRIHRTAEESSSGRIRKKLLGKSQGTKIRRRRRIRMMWLPRKSLEKRIHFFI